VHRSFSFAVYRLILFILLYRKVLSQETMSKGKLWGIILLILFVLGFGIWLYTSSDVKKDVDQEGIGVLDDMTIPAVD
jgi:cbb3-type cytochrome oxidase subunit 3